MGLYLTSLRHPRCTPGHASAWSGRDSSPIPFRHLIGVPRSPGSLFHAREVQCATPVREGAGGLERRGTRHGASCTRARRTSSGGGLPDRTGTEGDGFPGREGPERLVRSTSVLPAPRRPPGRGHGTAMWAPTCGLGLAPSRQVWRGTPRLSRYFLMAARRRSSLAPSGRCSCSSRRMRRVTATSSVSRDSVDW